MAVSWNADELGPEYVFIGDIKYQLKQNGPTFWPITIVPENHGIKGVSLVIQEPIAISSQPPVLQIHEGENVYDEHFCINYVKEPEATALSEEITAEVIARCLARKTKLEQINQRKMLCGLDSLYYLSKIIRKPINYESLLKMLPEASVRGATLAELQQVGATIGIKLSGYALSWEDIKRLKKPAILSWRPAHFVLYVPESEGVITPPFSTDIPNDERAHALFTGNALVYEGI